MRGRRISIRVHPLRGVVVSVPFHLAYDAGIRFFLQKRDWVAEVLQRQRQRLSDAEESGTAVGTVADGTIVRTLLSEIVFSGASSFQHLCGTSGSPAVDRSGRAASPSRYAVKVDSVLVEDVKLTGRLFLSLDRPLSRKNVSFPASATSDALAGVLVKILRDEAKSLLPKKLDFFAMRYGFTYGKVTIKHNLSNWGSCSTKGNINLNLNLVRLPEPVCDYVLLHELCHLRYPNHGQDFHILLERLCADNISRLSDLFLNAESGPAAASANDRTELPRDSHFPRLLAAIRRSRARFPVHHVLEQEVKKYRLL